MKLIVFVTEDVAPVEVAGHVVVLVTLVVVVIVMEVTVVIPLAVDSLKILLLYTK